LSRTPRIIATLALVSACTAHHAIDGGPRSGSNGGGQDGAILGGSGLPGVGAHGIAYYHLGSNNETSIATPSLDTQPTGSTMIVAVGRGMLSGFALPTDNKGNAPYQQLGQVEPYHYYPNSGTATYAFPNMVGGPGDVVQTSNIAQDEITLAAVEVVDATHVADMSWIDATDNPTTSMPVTTTGPATLVAIWWGEANSQPDPQQAMVQDGFTIIDSALDAGSLVQCAVAVKNVGSAGTYSVAWTAVPTQVAELWLIAVQ
jgi:hypothetical protein